MVEWTHSLLGVLRACCVACCVLRRIYDRAEESGGELANRNVRRRGTFDNTERPFRKKRRPGPLAVWAACDPPARAASRSRGLDQRDSKPVAAAVRRAAAASMDAPDAPQPLPSARSKFDAVPHAQPSGASFCALRRHISSRLHSRIRLRRSIMPPSTLPPSARRCARACKVLP